MQDLEHKTDEALVALSQRGDVLATECLLKRYSAFVRARARRFFLLGWEMDDLVQEGMIALNTAIGSYRAEYGKSFKNFAYVCVRRRIISFVDAESKRSLRAGVSIDEPGFAEPQDGQSPESELIDSELRAEFWRKIGGVLSDFEFRVIAMYLDGMSYREICAAAGKDVKSVDNALSRAKNKLRRLLSDGARG